MLATASLFAAALLSQSSTAVQPPDLTLPPETAATVTILEGRGVQIYTCALAPGSGSTHYTWLFTAPEAQLFNLATGKPVGHHDAGPTWTLDDGSSVRGTVLQKKAADTPADVPWLLLRADPATASATPGILTPVTFVRRYNTHGGIPPAAGCDATHKGQTLRVPYTASYAFYATQAPAPNER